MQAAAAVQLLLRSSKLHRPCADARLHKSVKTTKKSSITWGADRDPDDEAAEGHCKRVKV